MKQICVKRSRYFSRLSILIALSLAVVCSIALPLSVFAHPLGNFTVNRYSRIEATTDGLQLLYIIDMAEIPAHQERVLIDGNDDGELSEREQQTYLDRLSATLATDLRLTLNGESVPWQLIEQQMTFPTGQAGLPTLRVVTKWQATAADNATLWTATYEDKSFAERLGWQEVIVRGTDTAKLIDATVPAVDISAELTVYPEDLLQSPLAVTEATFQFEPHVGAQNAMSEGASSSSISAAMAPLRSGFSADPFAELINITTLSLPAILLALIAAFGWGAAHAFSPGHGKTVVAAYLVGSRGTVAHALFLGVTTTVTHTAGVFVLGLITLFASHYILPETLYPWLSVISGLLVVAIGLSMVRDRWKKPVHVHHHGHEHHHDHGHSHGIFGHHHHHVHEHSHHGHSHMPPGSDGTPVTWRSLLALGISGGLLPCPSALVLMLGAISLNRIGFGLALIVLFSLGLASVLTAIGITLVYAGKYFERIPESGRLLRFMPVVSAIVITAIGLGITIQALLSTGTLRLA